jgi:hypothetical protein
MIDKSIRITVQVFAVMVAAFSVRFDIVHFTKFTKSQ